MNQKKKISAVFPGSFDPITQGHIDLIKRFSIHFNPLIVLVSQSASKKNLFSLKERTHLAHICLKNIPKVKVVPYNGLTTEYIKKQDIRIIIRGVRTILDFEYERAMAEANKKLFPKCETLITFTKPEYAYLSSRLIKEMAIHGSYIKQGISDSVIQALKNKIK